MEGALDEALRTISRTAPDFENGNTNHAPMVAETLVAIGRGDAVPRWLEGYRDDLRERPGDRPPIEGDWRDSLGKPDLWPSWVSYFRREMADRSWRDVLEAWASRLAPGLSGEATHGLIRTAHAVRALGMADTEPRRHEFADALAYWAATYRSLGVALPVVRPLSLDVALSQVPDLDPPRGRNIDETLAGLEGSAPFAPVINLLKTGHDPLDDLSAVTERFAAIYLSNCHDPSRLFAVVHAVTGPSSLRLLAPQVSRSTKELLLLYAWQAAAAIYSIWGKDRSTPVYSTGPRSGADLTEAAVANGAAHAIKFVEVCLREYESNPKPVYLAAAEDAARRLTA